MATFRFADPTYFQDGQWDEDLALGKEPVLVDPKWEKTILDQLLSGAQLPNEAGKNGSDSFWIATSGSTGLPKLIQKNRSHIEDEVNYWLSSSDIHFGWDWKSSRFHVTVPLCHLYGLIWGLFLPRAMGRSIIHSNPLQIKNEDLNENDILITVPYTLKRMYESGMNLPKRIITSGSKFPVPLAQRLRADGIVDIREIYGATETGAMGIRNPMWKARYTLLSVVEPKIETNSEIDVLLVKSKFVSKLSLELRSKETSQEFVPTSITDSDGYFFTNDAGDLSSEGWNYIGRIDRITKIKGKRVSLDFIESSISSIPNVKEVAVISLESKDQEAELACLIVTSKSKEEIQKQLVDTLPASHIPKKIEITEIINKLQNGKTDYLSISKYFQLKSLNQIEL
ncbi:MAG: AMP-binding protein [Leptospira sp.]|nr:AMP-binding protein [Leptospira sp.]